MSTYPPPPSTHDQAHYNGIYPASTGARPLLESTQDDELQFGNFNQTLYSKVDAVGEPSYGAASASLTPGFDTHATMGEHQRQQLQRAAQQLQADPSGNVVVPLTIPLQTQEDGGGESPKINRLRKACDSCSIRKVKCDESGPPCKACAALEIPCTFDRPTRRRGPPNKHAEAVKRRRVGEAASIDSQEISGTSMPSSPTHAAQALASLSSHPTAPLSAESICQIDTLELLIDEFFAYIHPIHPFPHEPSFREAWKRREDLSNPSFLALLASMVGVLVASFQRQPRLYLKAKKVEPSPPQHTDLIQRCQKVCAAARGFGYLESENLNVYDAATSYFLGLIGVYRLKFRLGRLYFGECLNILRVLGFHFLREPSPNRSGGLIGSLSGYPDDGPDPQTVDNISIEMERRIFYTVYVRLRWTGQMENDFHELIILPPASDDPYPDMPAEVDDFCIYPGQTEAQPTGLVPLMAGFNANVRIFLTYNVFSVLDMNRGERGDMEKQKQLLHESLRKCKEALGELPAELIYHPDVTTLRSSPENNILHPRSYYGFPHLLRASAGPDSLANPLHVQDPKPEDRRRFQYDTQKASIYMSSLTTRAHLVEKFFELFTSDQLEIIQLRMHVVATTPAIRDAVRDKKNKTNTSNQSSDTDLILQEMWREREAIMHEIVLLLSTLESYNIEPIVESPMMIVRTLARKMIGAPDERKGDLALDVDQYLRQFLYALSHIAFLHDPAVPDDEKPPDHKRAEAESLNWSEIESWQPELAKLCGVVEKKDKRG